MTWTLHYIAGTKYGIAYPHWFFGHFATAATGEAVRRQCAHPDQIEVVEEGGGA